MQHNNTGPMKKPELMAPAGDMTSLRAALDAGADAVYFGVVSMNMRASARNFAVEDMVTIASLCHAGGAKAYLALNTIVFDRELELAENLVAAAAAAGVDAIICWDFAILELALRHRVAVFVSTQMSVANSASLLFLYRQFGVRRFVLARECTLDEIVQIRGQLAARLGSEAENIELEVFAHGAMCVSVSGRCFMSQFGFDASANRGECRQPCRREYLIKDVREGKEFLLGQDYVMSPKDLCSLPFLDQILAAGVNSLKIEGRGRSPEYVSVVTACYRQFIDFYYDHRREPDFAVRLADLKKQLMTRLDSVFHRGFSEGFFFGRQISQWTGGNGSKATHRKVHVGVVTNFFRKVMVAEIRVEGAGFACGDELMFQGSATGVVSIRVESIEEAFKPVQCAKKDSLVGVKLAGIVRENDQVYRIVPVDEVDNARQ
ncbi:MAG TPA: peptidase U32 family protein [Candidatus Rifleibacterium sp.]|nr:peptidase U32 family protein [Candidatus Rifleibacterium sp.]HPT44284.1 peptidase U32 family protein [Candidatus Rifleibacterium sp.]